ncbi:conserved Plasmodium protein, unknown function [Plasmodium ovale]|uniref:GPI transamidase component GPI17 n=1 Tax=Plasmodium ovale TaxID=36330 RepID=A0A1D3JG19_PLAOA|nr:conserved Plasmodium protein, unknown function [Plasmodium ovale]
MNSRNYCVIFYAISLFVYTLVIYSLNKYERYKVPTEKLRTLSKWVLEVYKNGNNVDKGLNEEKECCSNIGISMYIISGCGKKKEDIFSSRLKEFIEKQIIVDKKQKETSNDLFDIKDLFHINLFVVNRDMINNNKNGKYSNMCKKLFSKNENDNFISNTYYIYLNENPKQEENNLSFKLSTTNIIEIYYNKVEDEKNNYYEQFIKETWNVLKNSFLFRTNKRLLQFVPELDLNFYLASCLYNEQNYKIGKYTPGKDKPKQGSNLNQGNGEQEGNLGHIEVDIYDEKKKKANNDEKGAELTGYGFPPSVVIATWDFYKNFYYPYMRNFIEKLLNIFQINIYEQVISNIDLFKISEEQHVYVKEKMSNGKDNIRLILLDKVAKFTNAFDEVIFDNILKKPTYEIPKSINLIAIFPNDQKFFFYNDLNEKMETAVSFIEWGVIYIDNSFSHLTNLQKKKKLIDISDKSQLISGMFVSHLRSFLGLCANFSTCIYSIFNPDMYKVKYLTNTSTGKNNSIEYSITSNGDHSCSSSFIYDIPLTDGISDSEALVLMREAYTYFIIEALHNLSKYLSISSISIYMRIPRHSLDVFNNILNNIECSLNYIHGMGCKMSHINGAIQDGFRSYVKGDVDDEVGANDTLGSSSPSSNDNHRKKGVYFKAAITLAQAAYQDSLQLLNDDTISIYDILSKDFLLASILPVLVPYVIPVLFSMFREFYKGNKKEKTKVD